MTDRATEPGLLEEARDQLRAALTSNENRVSTANTMHSGQSAEKAALLAEINQRRMEIAEGFTRLAAIERGLPPCCHHPQPDPEPQS